MPCDPPDPKLRETVLSALRASGFPIAFMPSKRVSAPSASLTTRATRSGHCPPRVVARATPASGDDRAVA
jgi:hypothetical protein